MDFILLILLHIKNGTPYALLIHMNRTKQIKNCNELDIKEGTAMYAKFPFYSIAQIYAISLDSPVSILLGGDNLYWVVDRHMAREYLDKGCALLHATN